MVLSRGQRRELLAQVRSRRPVDPARLPLARDLARRLVDQTRFVVLYSGVVVSQIGQAILTPETWRVAMSAGLTFFFALVVALVARDVRRARRFLSQHPAPSADQDG
jgi:hypothetical protein